MNIEISTTAGTLRMLTKAEISEAGKGKKLQVATLTRAITSHLKQCSGLLQGLW